MKLFLKEFGIHFKHNLGILKFFGTYNVLHTHCVLRIQCDEQTMYVVSRPMGSHSCRNLVTGVIFSYLASYDVFDILRLQILKRNDSDRPSHNVTLFVQSICNRDLKILLEVGIAKTNKRVDFIQNK